MEIEAKGIAIRFGPMALLEGVDLAMRGGEMVGLIGPNGSGKTTLLRVLANLRAPEAGRVHYAGRTAAEIGTRELSRQIAYLAQGGAVHWPMRVETLVALGRLPHRRPLQGLDAADRSAIAPGQKEGAFCVAEEWVPALVEQVATLPPEGRHEVRMVSMEPIRKVDERAKGTPRLGGNDLERRHWPSVARSTESSQRRILDALR